MTEENQRQAVVVSACSRKGGVGKSTLMQNLAVYMAKQPQVHKILLIDLDSQMNLTSNYEKSISKEDLANSNIYRAYKHDAINARAPYPKNFKPVKVNPKIWLFSSSTSMDNIDALLKGHHDEAIEPYILLHLISAMKLANKFDYILLDCHGDFSLATQQALVVSDKVIVPITPSRYGADSIPFLRSSVSDLRKHLINPVTNQSFVNCKLLFVGNMIRQNTNSSHAFLDAVKAHPDMFKAAFPYREIFNRATAQYTDVFHLANDIDSGSKASTDKRVIDEHIAPQFAKLFKAINK